MNTIAEKSAIEKLLSFYGEALNASDVSKTVALFMPLPGRTNHSQKVIQE
jgi:hypothetical protein